MGWHVVCDHQWRFDCHTHTRFLDEFDQRFQSHSELKTMYVYYSNSPLDRFQSRLHVYTMVIINWFGWSGIMFYCKNIYNVLVDEASTLAISLFNRCKLLYGLRVCTGR